MRNDRLTAGISPGKDTARQKVLNEIAARTSPVPPYIARMSLQLASLRWEHKKISAGYDVQPELCAEPGTIFGGYAAAIHDQVSGLAMFTYMLDDHMFITARLDVSFLSVLRPGPARASAEVVSANGNRAEVRVMIMQDGVATSRAAVTQVLRPAR